MAAMARLQKSGFDVIFSDMIALYLFNTVLPILLLLLLSSFIHVLVHELGHAAPVLAVNQTWATVYVGSYGDSGRSFGFRAGRLNIWIKYNPFLWFRGMCLYGGNHLSTNRQIGCVLAGPLASILLGIVSCLLLQIGEIPGFFKLWLGFTALFAILGLLGSTFPAGRRRHTRDGIPVHPDLMLAYRLWRSKRLA